jgi:hypothetical protein
MYHFKDGDSMKTSTFLLYILIGLIAVTIVACVPGGGEFHKSNPAGLLFGIWHGWIAPVSLIISFFSTSIRIYEVYNTGFWYDFGFYIAVISGFGGLSLTRKKWKSNKKS